MLKRARLLCYLVICVSLAILSIVLGAWSVRCVGRVDWVNCSCFLSFVFLSGARRLELPPCNKHKCIWHALSVLGMLCRYSTSICGCLSEDATWKHASWNSHSNHECRPVRVGTSNETHTGNAVNSSTGALLRFIPSHDLKVTG